MKNTEAVTALTAQEFALYIGQDIEYPDTDSSTIRAILTGVSRTDGLETTYKKRKAGEPSGDYLAFKPNGNHNSDALHARLVLRHLSDNLLFAMVSNLCIELV